MRWRTNRCGAQWQTHHQLGMIRQPRRSTAACDCGVAVAAATITNFPATTTKLSKNVTMSVRNVKRARANSLNFISFLIFAFLYLQSLSPCGAWPESVASSSLSAASSSYEEDVVAVGSSSHEPKFGERLLPLRKKTSANIKYAGAASSGSVGASANLTTTNLNPSTTTQASTTTTTTVKSVSSINLNKNNYVVSNSQQQRQQLQQKQQQLFSSDINNNKHKDYLEVPEVITVVPLNDLHAQQPSRRKGKQLLHRRQDVNIAEVFELTEPRHSPSSTSDSTSNSSISKADRLVHMSTEFFVIPTASTSSNSGSIISSTLATKSRSSVKSSRGVPVGPRSVLIVAPKSSGAPIFNTTASASTPTIISTHSPFGAGGLRKEPWVVPVLVLASLTMLMMAAFEIFVLFKAWRTSPSRRHLFLGQMLLLGLFACAGLGAIITAQPSLLSCGTIRFGVGVAYALVFAALLVKCVFLISLNGGVYLPAPYQGLLLLFAVLIQVAIGAQWLLTTPPEVFTLSVPLVGNNFFTSAAASATGGTSPSSSAAAFARVFNGAVKTPAEVYTHTTSTAATGLLIPLCKTQFSELLLSLIYIIFLIVFVSVLAIKSRGIRDNYREATYIGLAIGGAIPIWLGWMLCGLAVAERHKDACIAFGLVATSATVFLVMFMPKGRQLAAMGKEGLYVEDREEQFSSLSRAGSGYSPSFFHFKPIKYGVMGGMQNSTSNTGNATSMKHCSNGHNGGDRVALVTAAPPSYTRMYHYFPAHLTHPFCFYPQPPPPPLPPLPTQMAQLQMKAPPPIPPPTLKQLGNSITSMTQAHIAQTLRYPGLFIRPDETNLYTTLEPTLSSNPNVYFQRGGAVHPGMMY